MTRYSDIIKRLTNATGPDRLIDVLVAYATDYVVEDISLRERMDRHGVEKMLEKVENSYNSVWRLLPRYTASIDASIALAERMLPKGVRITTMGDDDGLCCYCRFVIFQNGLGVEEGKIDVRCWRQNLPIAILLALFRALEAKEAQP